MKFGPKLISSLLPFFWMLCCLVKHREKLKTPWPESMSEVSANLLALKVLHERLKL
jgi:hypothetical protein